MNIKEGIKKAKEAQKLAYAPYSKFNVGAAFYFKDGTYVLGANIENSSYGLSICAERTALFKSVLAKKDFKNLEAIFIRGETTNPISPCGACRQVLSEFISDKVKIYLISKSDTVKETNITKLLPYSFSGSDL